MPPKQLQFGRFMSTSNFNQSVITDSEETQLYCSHSGAVWLHFTPPELITQTETLSFSRSEGTPVKAAGAPLISTNSTISKQQWYIMAHNFAFRIISSFLKLRIFKSTLSQKDIDHILHIRLPSSRGVQTRTWQRTPFLTMLLKR